MADLRFERTEQMIQLNFLKLLDTTNFNDISIAKLAKASLIDRTTFYAHYNNIYELAENLVEQNLAPFKAALSESRKKRRDRNFDNYSFFTHELVDYLITHRLELLKIRSLQLGTKSFDQQLRSFFSDIYAEITRSSKNDFTIYLLVNLAMSDLDFVLENERVPTRNELQQSFNKIDTFIK